jgi:hypothetical protein
MELKLQDVYSNELTRLLILSKDFKYEKSGELSNYLAYTALTLQSKILVFISEFLVYMYENMEYAEIKNENKDAKTINKEILNFLEELKKIDISKAENKNKAIDLMIEMRYKVSQFQVNIDTKDEKLLK